MNYHRTQLAIGGGPFCREAVKRFAVVSIYDTFEKYIYPYFNLPYDTELGIQHLFNWAYENKKSQKKAPESMQFMYEIFHKPICITIERAWDHEN